MVSEYTQKIQAVYKLISAWGTAMEEKRPAHVEFQALKDKFDECPNIMRDAISDAKEFQTIMMGMSEVQTGMKPVSRAHPSHPQNRLARVLILQATFK